MVGFHKHDSLTAPQKFGAGCVSGVVTRFITQPMDVIKLKTQLQKNQAKVQSTLKLLKHIFKEEGAGAFWQGHNLGQVHSVVSVSTQFYLYEVASKYLLNHPMYHKNYKPLVTFACGTFAGCASATLVIPLEVIRVRQMIGRDQYGGLIRGAKAVYSSGGMLAFYEGLTASLLQMGLQVGIAFSVFTAVQSWVLHVITVKCSSGSCTHAIGNVYHPKDLLLATTVAGSASAFFSKTLTYPLDLTKKRLQISSHKENVSFQTPSTSQNLIKCSNLLQCLKKTMQYEGVRGLYRGWLVTMYKAQITSIVAFTSYELTCFAIREVGNQ